MTHYFKNPENLPKNRREITFRFLGISASFIVDDGIFSKNKPDEGSLLLVQEVLDLEPEGKLLDLGSGYGLMTLLLKQHAPSLSVTGIEVNPRAHECALESAQLMKLDATFENADILEGFNGSYDWIITNPPIRAGKPVVYGFFKIAKGHLTPGGRLITVIRRQQGAASAAEELKRHFGEVRRLCLKKGYEVLEAKFPLTS